MTYSLSSLPKELVSSSLLPLLGPDDIINLSKCMDLQITQEVYHQAFEGNVCFDHYDLKMFEDRAEAKLYFLGDPMAMRPAESDQPSAYYEIIERDGTKFRRMHTPFEIKFHVRTIQRVTLADGWLHILSTEGNLWTFRFYPRVRDENHILEPQNLKGRTEFNVNEDPLEAHYDPDSESEADDGTQPRTRHTETYLETKEDVSRICRELDSASDRYIFQPFRPSRFVQIASCNVFCALDDSGLLWCWISDWQGFPLLLLDENGKVVTGRIVKMRSTSYWNLCQMDNGDILSWTVVQAGSRNFHSGHGYPTVDGHFAYAEVSTAFRGADKVMNFGIVGSAILLCLMNDGTLKARHIDNLIKTPDAVDVKKINQLGPFTQLSTVYHGATLLTKEGNVVVLDPKGSGFNIISEIPGLEGLKIAMMAGGGPRCLFLTQERDVYSWGEEMCANGSLGLGRLADALKLEGVTQKQSYPYDLCVKRATKISLPGKACAVFVTEKYSGILVTKGKG